MIDFLSAETRRNPYPTYDQLRRAAPVLQDPRTGSWMLFDYESAKRALTDHAAFSSEVSPPGSRTAQWLIFTDPPRHTQLRALVSRAFTSRAVAGLELRIRELSGELLDRVAERGEMDLVADFSVNLVGRTLLREGASATVALPRERLRVYPGTDGDAG